MRSSGSRLALAMLWVGVAAACASPGVPRDRLEGWHSVETAGLRIVAEATAQQLDALASDLAGFDAAFVHLLGHRIPSATPTTFYLFGDRALAARFQVGGGVAGWALPTLDGSYSCVLLQASAVHTRIALLHEYMHLLLARQRDALLPLWYNEGLAEYFSTLAIRDGALVVGSPLEGRLEVLAERGALPLEQLFAGFGALRIDRREIRDFYATSWALSHYLMGTPRGRGELSRFERQLARGVPLDAARESAFGRPLATLDAELARHVGHLLRGVPAVLVLDPSAIEIADPPAPEPLAADEVALELGSLALAMTAADEEREWIDPRLPRTLLATATATGPASPRARAALAYAAALAGDADGAGAAIAGALRDAPADARVQRLAGEIALASDGADAAGQHFERAIEIDARSAAAWFGLGRALERGERADAARGAYERARELGWSHALDLALGRIHLEAGRRDAAVALLQPLAQDPHRGPSGEQAAELLREAGLGPAGGEE